MKKLLLLAFITSTAFASAQVLESDDFNSLTEGNVTTVPDELGQGGFFTINYLEEGSTTTNVSESNYKIIASGMETHGNVFEFTGNNGNLAESYMWKPDLNVAWDNRVEGNDILELSVDINPGAAGSSSLNTFGLRLYDVDYKTLAGIFVNINSLELIAYSGTSNPDENYNYFPLGKTLTASEWTKLSVAYYPTGEVYVRVGESEPIKLSGTLVSAPFEIDFETGLSDQDNSSAESVLFDNYSVSAVKEAFLAVEKNNLAVGSKVYPNPTTDILNVSIENKTIDAISITDLNGRIVKSKNYGNISKLSLSVSDLAAGMYMMNITSDKGTFTKKIIKN